MSTIWREAAGAGMNIALALIAGSIKPARY
jgi:hypothetical protein